MAITQEERQVQLFSSLGDDVLYLDRFTGREEISRLFKFELGVYSEDREVVFDEIVGQGITVSVDRVGAGPKFFHGFVSSFEHVMDLSDFAYYRIEAVPWLWFLTRTADCRLFQGMTAPDIVLDVIRQHGFSDIEVHLTEDYEPLEYCTQYRETDFNFVSRLMEEFGIHYTFKHEADRHVLKIGDSLSAFDRVGGLEKIPFHPATEDNRPENTIWAWTVGRRVQPFKYEVLDFDYHAPKAPVVSTEAGEAREHEHSSYEIYDYAGMRQKPDPNNDVARTRVEEFDSQHERAHAMMGSAGLGAGHLFAMTDAPRADQAREYLVLGAEHRILTNRFRSGGETTEGGETYENRFSCLAATVPFRPARLTPRPSIQGPHTATVTGPDKEEIHIDAQGRVKCRFHWDRAKNKNEDSTIWIRVAQAWAGNKYGALFLPRVGHEVVVNFLEGDPDRPLITGSVYNDANPPPYINRLQDEPDMGTVATIASNTSKGGDGANVILWQDKKEEEKFYFRAQRDLIIKALNDRFETISNDRHLVVEGNMKDRVEKNRHEVVKKSHNESIGGDRHLSVGGKEAKKIGASQSLTVDEDRLVSISGLHQQEAGTYDLSAGEVTITGSSKITLVCGGSSIEISPGSVKIAAPSIELQASGALKGMGGTAEIMAAKIDLKAPMVETPLLLKTTTLLASAVIGTSYTPGVGNIM